MLFGRFTPLVFLSFIERIIAGVIKPIVNTQGQKTALLTNGTVCFLDNIHVKVPKIGLLRVAGSQARLLKRICETRIGTVTLTKDSADRFFLSMQLASDESFVKVAKATHGHVGIDLNTDNFLTDSGGNIVPNPRYYRTIKR